ncbi:MAG: SO2930 family diheme c-type cytochrome [Sneathiella sp.]
MRHLKFLFLVVLGLSTASGTGHLAASDVRDDLLRQKKPAKTLSAYGLFSGPNQRVPAASLIDYDLNNPLFTDYARKFRYVYVPEEAAPTPLQMTHALDFPVGSVLVKTFAYPASFKNPDQDIRFIETRLLVHKEDGWKGYPYVWNDDQTEAFLKVAGKRLNIEVEWDDGRSEVIPYVVPNMNQCKGCHGDAEKKLGPVGPKIRNLNRPHKSARQNQISYLQERGYLERTTTSLTDFPRVPDPFDPSDGTLEARARSYLDGNCAHCHSPGRPADTSGLYLDYTEEREVHWGLNKPPVAAGRGSGGLDVDIAPGDPERSILFYRMKSTDPGIMMPELGRSLVHEEAIKLISDFIKALE